MGDDLLNDLLNDFAIVKINCLIDLLKNGSNGIKRKIINSDVMKKIMNKLWDCLSSEKHCQITVELLIEFETVSHDDFIDVIEDKLKCPKYVPFESKSLSLVSLESANLSEFEGDIDKCLYNINIFTLF